MKHFYLLLILFCFFSCKENKKNNIIQLIQEWKNKEIIFPNHLVFTVLGEDTVNFSFSNTQYRVLSYMDSIGCTSCKLQLSQWKNFISEVDSLTGPKTAFVFYFSPKNVDELHYIIRREAFKYPVCFDKNDSLNKLNHFPADIDFQTFLLDKNNEVIAIGNPIRNPKIKELYMKILLGKETVSKNENTILETEVSLNSTSLPLGNFSWEKEQKVVFTLKNTGDNTLVIDAVAMSCGCTKVEYDKEPVRPGGSVDLHVSYKAEHPEHFNKTITVYCNAKVSPLLLKIMGNAE